MKLDDFYRFEYSDYCLHLYCYIHNILADMSFGLLQAFLNGIRTIYHCGLNKGFGLKFKAGSWVWQETPEDGSMH